MPRARPIDGFPEHDLTKTDAWTRAPRTRVMPDRFVLLLYPSNAPRVRSSARRFPTLSRSGLIRSTPRPLSAEKDDALTYGPQFDWMSNFDNAVEQGMGFRVPLNPERSGRRLRESLGAGRHALRRRSRIVRPCSKS